MICIVVSRIKNSKHSLENLRKLLFSIPYIIKRHKSDSLIPAATFAEANGTVINHEGRAQAFYKILSESSPTDSCFLALAEDLISVKTVEQEKK